MQPEEKQKKNGKRRTQFVILVAIIIIAAIATYLINWQAEFTRFKKIMATGKNTCRGGQLSQNCILTRGLNFINSVSYIHRNCKVGINTTFMFIIGGAFEVITSI